MATKIESSEITQPKKVYVKSEQALDEMEKNGQLEPFTDYFTPDDEDADEIEKHFDLLWQNSNPSVAQGSQSIPIANLSQYNTFVIKVQRAIDHTLVYNYSNHAITPEDNICFNTIGVFGYISYCRNVYVNLSSGELVINNGYVQSAIGSGAVNNDKLIVTHLYGLKTRLYTKLGELPDAELSETSENAVQNKAVTAELNNKINKDKLTLVNLLTGDINSNTTYTLARPVTDFTFICLRFKWTNGYGSDFLTIPSTSCLNYNTEDARMVASTDAQYFAFYFPNASSWVSPNRSWGCFVQIYGIL